MKTIWKYVLQPECSLEIPRGAELLSVHEQGESICLWVLVDPSLEKEVRKFIVLGTGHDVPDVSLKFVGTAHLNASALVFHVFEKA